MTLQSLDLTLIVQEFNSLKLENGMKIKPINPAENCYDPCTANIIAVFAWHHPFAQRSMKYVSAARTRLSTNLVRSGKFV